LSETQSVQIEGELTHIVYSSEETGYTVARILRKGHERPTTIVGTLPTITPGLTLQLTGRWTQHKRFGRQFQVEACSVVTPATAESIQRYLASGLIHGVGPAMAKRLVDRFGNDTIDIIDNEPDRLSEVAGFGPQRIAKIRDVWKSQREIRQIMMFLQEQGVGLSLAFKIYKQYHEKAIPLLRENPYRLASELFGVGFKTADRIARNMGVEPNSDQRAEAGVLYVLQESVAEGNVFLPYELLLERSRVILEIQDTEILRKAVAGLFTDKQIYLEDYNEEMETFQENRKAVYLPAFHAAEQGAASLLSDFVNLLPPAPLFDPARAVAEAEARMGMAFEPEQRQAVERALKEKCLIITGGPGTGKTTLVRILVDLCREIGYRCLLAAPTGRAAKRLQEVTGEPARTLHRLLEYGFQRGGFARNDKNPLEADLLIVDETSMIDVVLFYHLVKALPRSGSLILIGDVDQLPSVGPGRVLTDLIDCDRIGVVRLSRIFRQAQESRIITNAHRILEGKIPAEAEKLSSDERGEPLRDFYFIEEEDPEQAAERILELCAERIPGRFGFDPREDIQVITPMHRGAVGAENLNALLQQKLNPAGVSLQRGATIFRENDKVMQIRNNYDKEVFNGDIGRIRSVNAEEAEIVVRYDDQAVQYDAADLDELVPAYAITVHKAQGNEYPAVILPLMTQHYLLLQRNLLYTALTRGKKLVVVVGSRKALRIAVGNTKTRQRFTLLRQRLCHGIPA
jgi:exodeoxyribonuclease V alpha subunit